MKDIYRKRSLGFMLNKTNNIKKRLGDLLGIGKNALHPVEYNELIPDVQEILNKTNKIEAYLYEKRRQIKLK
jgi:hypothetical protein